MDKPLKGKNIVITRDPGQAKTLIEKLSSLGGTVFPLSTIKISPPSDWSPCDQALSRISDLNWIIFTSSNGVRYFMERADYKRTGKITPSIAAIGKNTKAELMKNNLQPDLIPDKFNAAGLLDAFKNVDLKNKKVLIPTSNIAHETIKHELTKRGADVTQVVCYQTLPSSEHALSFKKHLFAGDFDCITFYSPSSFHSFLNLLGDTVEKIKDNQKLALAAIGPTTARAIKKKGFSVTILPRQSVEESMVEAIVEYYNQN